jgi:hypothetical protein
MGQGSSNTGTNATNSPSRTNINPRTGERYDPTNPNDKNNPNNPANLRNQNPLSPPTAEVAKKCRAMMLTELPNMQPGKKMQQQREYFQDCIAQNSPQENKTEGRGK